MGLRSMFGARPPTGRANRSNQTYEYIDLEDQAASSPMAEARMRVKVAEIHKYEDLRELSSWVYGGNMLLLDFTPIAQEEIILKRVTGDLKKLVSDMDGDIAGLGKTMMMITPAGVKIDRQKARVAH